MLNNVFAPPTVFVETGQIACRKMVGTYFRETGKKRKSASLGRLPDVVQMRGGKHRLIVGRQRTGFDQNAWVKIKKFGQWNGNCWYGIAAIGGFERQLHVFRVVIVHNIPTEVVDDDKIEQVQILVFFLVLRVMLYKRTNLCQLV